MTEYVTAFLIWTIVGIIFILGGLMCFYSKNPKGFWSNIKTFEVTDVKAYNKALGKLWIVYGAITILLGLPILAGEGSPLIVISIVGMMAEAIFAMVIYVIAIEPKYRKK